MTVPNAENTDQPVEGGTTLVGPDGLEVVVGSPTAVTNLVYGQGYTIKDDAEPAPAEQPAEAASAAAPAPSPAPPAEPQKAAAPQQPQPRQG